VIKSAFVTPTPPSLQDLPAPPPGKVGWPWTERAAAPSAEPSGAALGISVVMPSYQQGAFLEEAIRSVLLQGHGKLELIVQDGGSTDASVEILRRYEPWLAFWTSAKDGGQAAAINAGWRRARYELLTWLNSDDLLLPGWARRTTEAFAADAALDFTICDILVADLDRGTEHVFRTSEPTLERMITRWLSDFAQQGTAMRRRVLERCGQLDPDLHYTMDLEYWQRTLAAGCTYRRIPEPLASFRMHRDAKTRANHGKTIDELVMVTERFIARAAPEHGALAAAARRNLNWNAAHMAYDGHSFPAARRWALRYLAQGDPRAAPEAVGMILLASLGERGHRLLPWVQKVRALWPAAR
jgi:glycosyltransferase involved in cell wall biosynthesis